MAGRRRAPRWDPDHVKAWQRIARDAVTTFCGGFILLYQTVYATDPDAVLIGAALIALGLPSALRLDERNRARNGNGANGA